MPIACQSRRRGGNFFGRGDRPAVDKGKTCITLRYGAKVLEISKGKNAIETAGVAEVITSLQLLKAAVDAGELDAQMEALSGAVAEAFAPKPKVVIKAAAKA